ncbi:MAG: PAS domain S-box protein [Armatimonadota bacterium]|nr:PAS domain S-box protein [bacterium]
MNTSLRLLIVEDSEDDAFLLIRHLKQGGYDLTYRRVETAGEMSAALDEQQWDVVISDYVMPHFSGLSALKVMQEKGIDLPFIVVSGKIGEHIAVEAMKAGAHDYVLKDNLARLIPAIRREIQEAKDRQERRRVQDALKESERRLAEIINFLPDATFAIDENGIIIAWNRATEKMTGYKAEEMLGKGNCEHSIPFYGERRPALVNMVMKPIEEVRKMYDNLVVEGHTMMSEAYIPIPRGQSGYMWFKATPLYDMQGNVVGAIESVRDVTDRKMAEEHKREFYRRTILAATDGKLLITEKNEIERVAGNPIAVFEVRSGEDVGTTRNAITGIIQSSGLEESRVHDFSVAVGEALTNAFKHAGGGIASIHTLPKAIMVVVSDKGPGIEAMTIPKVALERGYTTAGTLGMGYKIIISVADRVHLTTGSAGTTVGIEMALEPSPEDMFRIARGTGWTE